MERSPKHLNWLFGSHINGILPIKERKRLAQQYIDTYTKTRVTPELLKVSDIKDIPEGIAIVSEIIDRDSKTQTLVARVSYCQFITTTDKEVVPLYSRLNIVDYMDSKEIKDIMTKDYELIENPYEYSIVTNQITVRRPNRVAALHFRKI